MARTFENARAMSNAIPIKRLGDRLCHQGQAGEGHSTHISPRLPLAEAFGHRSVEERDPLGGQHILIEFA